MAGIGVGGIFISVARLVLTTLCAGIHPSRTLPVVLECGTDVRNLSIRGERKNYSTVLQNDQLLNDDLHLGLRRPRVRGKEYDEVVDKFVRSVRKLYPGAYLHL